MDTGENGTTTKIRKPKISSNNNAAIQSCNFKTFGKIQRKVKVKKTVSTNKVKSKNSKKVMINQNDARRRENTLKLLQNSNICLFRSLRTKYGCYACKATFINVKELREHTVNHDNKKYLASRVNQLRGLSYKNVDISDLTCKICSRHCIDLIDLENHLTEKHNFQFGNTDHFLIPYRLKDEFRCVSCHDKFNTFTRLLIHMNTHYTNNVCDVCGQSFINRLSLRCHLQSVHTEKKCSLCPAILLTNSSKVKHMKKVHNVSCTQKRYCNLCNKSFRYTYMLEEHKIKDHNFQRPIAKCTECGKTFLNPQYLKIHTRSVHIKERNYPCDVCGMRFFTKCDQKRHERTHDDTRAFSCNYCDAKFKFKDSCRRHLKRQHGHVFGP